MKTIKTIKESLQWYLKLTVVVMMMCPLMACGQKGDLYMPEPEKSKTIIFIN